MAKEIVKKDRVVKPGPEKKPVVKAKPKVIRKPLKKVAKPVIEEKDYSSDVEYICLEIEKGFSLRSACKSFMTRKKFFELIDSSDEMRNQYVRACEARAESIFEDIIDIADTSNGDLSFIDGKIVVDGEAIQRSRLKIDARKWMLSKMAPKKYGDKLDVTTDGEKLNSDAIDYTKLSDAVLEEISRARPE